MFKDLLTLRVREEYEELCKDTCIFGGNHEITQHRRARWMALDEFFRDLYPAEEYL